jgi:hypothetical protein
VFGVHLDSPRESFLVEGQDRPRKDLRLDAATRAPDRRALVGQGLVSIDTDLQQFECLRLERVRLQPGAVSRRSSDWRLTTHPQKLDFGVDPFHRRVKIASAVGLVAPSHSGGDLVLLRHRPCSISR